ncbi:DUF881 domain-containing protein [Cellulomonas humilata]|uniref:Uncharacterized protein YlxW (UPF0749 family) n=1 Tax=Cellulomonas humilata TaxID=144055 RepID=A0ABU0EHL8_9CELL|nr:DUF881 domain-containing protein [Cellulomonas humilata]MDQ0374545.1 uncharacterized protein YlxW (UPF0749 family) [Cellulomonas humilata]
MNEPLDGPQQQDDRLPADEPNSLPPVVPEDEPNSLPPVVPDDEPDEVNSLPPVVPEDEPDDVNSLPPVVPEDEPDDANSLPPVVPEDEPDDISSPSDVREPQTEPVPHDVRVFVAPDFTPAEPDAPEAPEALPGATESDETVVETAPPAPSSWAVLGQALKPRANRAQLLAGVLCAVLGFALVAQVRQSGETDLAGMRQGDLVRILDETTNRGDALAREAADLARERDDLLSGSDRRQAALDALRRSAETQGILAGRLPAEGPGVIVTLTETDRFIKPITMLNMLEEMRNAGAEAIQLNDQRVTASSAFTGARGAVVLDGVELSAPYRWLAIGDPDIIAPALQIPGGAMAQVRNDGGKGTVDRLDLVEVDAVRAVPDPVYATPVPPQAD